MDTNHTSLLDLLPSADELLARRAEIVRHLTPLRAKYGGQGYMGERVFKAEEAKVDAVVRAALKAEGGKVTEPMVDALVRTHPAYMEAITADLKARAEWIGHEEALNEIEWRLNVRRSDAALLAAEARLTPGA